LFFGELLLPGGNVILYLSNIAYRTLRTVSIIATAKIVSQHGDVIKSHDQSIIPPSFRALMVRAGSKVTAAKMIVSPARGQNLAFIPIPSPEFLAGLFRSGIGKFLITVVEVFRYLD